MFYHALTGGNTPTEDLEPVLLWENSNPTAAFAAQTISLDLSDYVGVIIEFNGSTTDQTVVGRLYCKKTDNYDKYTGIGFTATISSAFVTYARNILNVDNNGVGFGSSTNNNTVNDQTPHIPIRIYGVKAYVVEPQIGDLLWTNPAPAASFGAQKISVDLSNAKGVIIECMISHNTQMPNSRVLIYKGETPFGIGYSAGTVGTSRNVTAIEDDGVTFATAYVGASEDAEAIIPYKIYAIN